MTDVQVRNAKPASKPRKLYDSKGLYLIVTPSGGRWWRFKYQFNNREKLISLGTYPELSLRQARDRRDEARRLLAEGRDPSIERQTTKAAALEARRREADSFEAVAREWFAKFSQAWVPEHTETVISRLEADVLPWLGPEPVAGITSTQVLQILRRVEARGAVSTAHRIKQIVSSVFRYSIATGRATRDPAADLRGALGPERQKHFGAVVKPTDIAGLMRAIDSYSGSFIVRCAMRFSAYTFSRPGEIRKAEWSEFDLDAALWRIPAARMKMRREHLVPLSRQAIEVLKEIRPLTGAGRFMFPGRTSTRPLSENAITAAFRRMGYEKGEMTAHGFRTMASTMLNELQWPADVIEKQLAHAPRDEVRGAYNRAEYLKERTEMMTAWADYLDRLAEGGKLIELHQKEY